MDRTRAPKPSFRPAILVWGLLGLICGGLCPDSAAAVGVRIDTAAAQAVVQALREGSVSRSRALEIARLPGNVGLRRKQAGYGQPHSEEAFAEALMEAASGNCGENDPFRFCKAKEELAAVLSTVEAASRDEFRSWIEERVRRFAPSSISGEITGHMIVGGASAGFAFSEPAFYLDVGRFAGDPGAARAITAHELFHAVQIMTAASAQRPVGWWDSGEAERLTGDARTCFTINAFFGRLMTEGTASLVGDVTELNVSEGAASRFQKERFERGLARLDRHVAMLEMATIGLAADPPVSYDDAYLLGFHQDENFYFLGYAMARAIAAERGEGAIADLLGQAGGAFVRTYIELPATGLTAGAPQLGPHTRLWAARTSAGCDTPADPSGR